VKRHPIRTGILLAVTALVWLLAVKTNFPADESPPATGAARHLPHIDVGPGGPLVTAEDPAYTFNVPTGFAVSPDTGGLIPVSWLPTDARITHGATTVAIDTDELGDTELLTSTDANPDGLPAGRTETIAMSDFRVVVSESEHVYTAYHGRTVVTFTSTPPAPGIDVFDPAVFPTAMQFILGSLEFG